MKLRKLLHLFLLLFADETPENCALFLSNRGLELFMRCNKVSSNNYLREVASHLIVHACLREKGCTFGLTFPDFGRIPTLTQFLLCNVVKYYALCLFFFFTLFLVSTFIFQTFLLLNFFVFPFSSILVSFQRLVSSLISAPFSPTFLLVLKPHLYCNIQVYRIVLFHQSSKHGCFSFL